MYLKGPDLKIHQTTQTTKKAKNIKRHVINATKVAFPIRTHIIAIFGSQMIKTV